MCETRISTGRALDTDETARLCQILQSLSEHAVLPFESLKGEFESQPYQLVGPVQQAPIPEVSFHALVTHWDNKSDFDHWAASPAFATLGEFGPVTSEVFIEFVEVGDRDFMTDDRLQRDWKKASVG